MATLNDASPATSPAFNATFMELVLDTGSPTILQPISTWDTNNANPEVSPVCIAELDGLSLGAHNLDLRAGFNSLNGQALNALMIVQILPN
jgi:hypothetical protein